MADFYKTLWKDMLLKSSQKFLSLFIRDYPIPALYLRRTIFVRDYGWYGQRANKRRRKHEENRYKIFRELQRYSGDEM